MTAQTQDPMTIVRDRFPRLRRRAATAIVHSGGSATVFGCLCGASHSASRQHRDAAHVRAWLAAHSGCAAHLADLLRDPGGAGASLRLDTVTARHGRVAAQMPVVRS